MEKFLKYLKGKSIHIIGVTGAEGSNILRFLSKSQIVNITVHDFLLEGSIEKSFKLWHKGITTQERSRLFEAFLADLSKATFYSGRNYLKNITSADIIFVPQSWRLYKEKNLPLWEAKKKAIPFYSLTKLYLDYAPCKVVGVTGTVGKGSVANILFQLLRIAGKKVYFAGNETWMQQIADKLDVMEKKDILILEISHRQMQDGWSRAPDVVVFTNLHPNHLDEVSWEEYKNLKLSLLKSQSARDISILNYDSPELKRVAPKLISQVLFFSEKSRNVNTKNIQKIYGQIMSTKNDHLSINLLAASTTADLLGINCNQILSNLSKIHSLPARVEYIGKIGGIKFYDDIKSTTPWATLAAIKHLGSRLILICGGRTKGIDYGDFIKEVKQRVKFIIFLQSQLSGLVAKYLPSNLYKIVNTLDKAINLAHQKARPKDNIAVSPAAGFFYSDFIKGKTSLRKIIQKLRVNYHPGVRVESSEDPD